MKGMQRKSDRVVDHTVTVDSDGWVLIPMPDAQRFQVRLFKIKDNNNSEVVRQITTLTLYFITFRGVW